MEEIKRMIEEAKHPHFNDAGHPHEGTYMFSEELFEGDLNVAKKRFNKALFSLLEKVSKGGWSASRMSDMGNNWYRDDHNNYWDEFLKAIDN